MMQRFPDSAPTWTQRLGRELFGFDRPETTGDRVHFRLLELFLVAATSHLCWTWGLYIQRNVSAPVLELGIAQYIDVSFMFDHYVAVGNALLIIGLLGLGFFRVWRPAYLVALVLFHLQYVSRYILGKAAHGPNLVGMGILALGLAHLLFSEKSPQRRFVFGFLYFFIGLSYTSAALCKLIGTGPTWADGHHLWLWIAERKVDVMAQTGAFAPNVLQEWILRNVTLGTLVLGFSHVLELSGILIWWRRFRYPILLLLVGMHIGIIFTMNIVFFSTTVFLVLLGLPWGTGIDRMRAVQWTPPLSTEERAPN